MKKLLLMVLLSLVGGAVHAQSGRPGSKVTYPHFRPPEKRKLKHYKPKTWRERAPEPKSQPHGETGRPVGAVREQGPRKAL